MKLDKAQRWILVNQMRILAALYPSDREDYERTAEALGSGYELEYDLQAPHIYDEVLTEDECHEVRETMQMYWHMQGITKQLSDKTGVDEEKLFFRGYDGNNETKFMAYARYLHDMNLFASIEHAEGFDSHYINSRRDYGSMLQRYTTAIRRDHGDLTKDDIIEILAAPTRDRSA